MQFPRGAVGIGALSRRRLTGALLAGLLAPSGRALAQIVQVEPSGSASRLPSPDGASTYVPPRDLLTVADIYQRMTTPVKVNGQGPFPFVVDTGANQSVVSDVIATQLQLVVGAPEPLNSVVGVSMASTTHARLRFGGRDNDALLSVLPASGIGGPGVLGLDQLRGARVTLDFGARRVVVDGDGDLPGTGDEVRVDAYRRDGQLTLIDAELAGVHLTAFIDSGAQDTVGNMALRQLAVARAPTTIWSQVPVVSVTGAAAMCQFADLPSLRIGSLTLPNWPVAFADLHVFQMWNLVDKPAILLGVDVLSRFQAICLDFARDEVRLRLPGPELG
jgi:hypothetical protein